MPDMTTDPIDVEAARATLRSTAESALQDTEPPWALWPDLDEGFYVVGEELPEDEDCEVGHVAKVYIGSFAEFIAAASPDVVLGLLNEVVALRAALEELRVSFNGMAISGRALGNHDKERAALAADTLRGDPDGSST